MRKMLKTSEFAMELECKRRCYYLVFFPRYILGCYMIINFITRKKVFKQISNFCYVLKREPNVTKGKFRSYKYFSLEFVIFYLQKPKPQRYKVLKV